MTHRRILFPAAALAGLAALTVGSGTAAAHVSVLPPQVTVGESQEFTIRVPNERDRPTTAVTVTFPSQITVYAFADPGGGWKVTPVRAADGTFSGVEYRGGRIAASGYADFTVLGTPFETGDASFPARQIYSDGQVKPWTGPPEEPGAGAGESGPTEPGPAAVVSVSEQGAAAPPSAGGDADTPTASPAAEAADAGDDSGAGIWLGVIAIAISALAMLGVGLLWSTRPARLPDDE